MIEFDPRLVEYNLQSMILKLRFVERDRGKFISFKVGEEERFLGIFIFYPKENAILLQSRHSQIPTIEGLHTKYDVTIRNEGGLLNCEIENAIDQSIEYFQIADLEILTSNIKLQF